MIINTLLSNHSLSRKNISPCPYNQSRGNQCLTFLKGEGSLSYEKQIVEICINQYKN